MTRKFWMASMLLATIAVSAFAQDRAPRAAQPRAPREPFDVGAPPPPPHPPGLPRIPMAWWKDSQLAQELNLTDAQKAKLEQTFTDYRIRLIDLRATLDKEEARLQPMVEADRLDENQVSAQLDKVVAARGQLEKVSAMMSIAMRKDLTREQWKKLEGGQGRMRMRGGPEEGMGPTPHPSAPGRPPKAPAPPDGPNNTDGKGRPTTEQPR